MNRSVHGLGIAVSDWSKMIPLMFPVFAMISSGVLEGIGSSANVIIPYFLLIYGTSSCDYLSELTTKCEIVTDELHIQLTRNLIKYYDYLVSH